MFETKEATKKVGMTVEITSEDYPQIRTYEFPEFNRSQVDAIKRFLYAIDYLGAKNIRVTEGIDAQENLEGKKA